MEFKPSQQILFLWNGYNGTEPEEVFHGHITSVYKKTVSVCCLYGYKSINEDVPVEKILSVYDPNGEEHKIGCYSGKGILTEAGKNYLNENKSKEHFEISPLMEDDWKDDV